MEKENEISEENKEKQQENEDTKELKLTEEEVKNIEETEEIQENKEKIEEENESKNINENKEDKDNSSGKKSKNSLILIAIFVVILLFLSTIFAIINMNNVNIIKGVYIEGIDVSNISKEEISNIINNKIASIQSIEISYGKFCETIKVEDLKLQVDSKSAINKAINLGKSDNILIDNFNILKTMLLKTQFNLDIRIDEEKFNEIVKNIQAEIPDKIEQYSYEIKGEELIITNGKSGNQVIKEELKNIIISNIINQFNGINETSQVPVKYTHPEKIDIDKIYSEIYKEAKDAYIIEEPFELHKEEEGVELAITVEEAKKIISTDKEIYSIPLKITKPKVAVKDLGDKLFKQTLANYTTIYDAGNYNRSHNIALAAKTINGTILLPGETFSYNGILGNTNKAKGYKVGTAYVGGKVVESYGGGICQVSSTLYNAILYANLEVVERYNHSYVVNYVPAGRDATVAYGGKDFKFKNTRNYPIKIVASAKNGVVSITIKGIKEDKEYEVVLTSTVLSTTPNKTVYENNSSLAEGTEKVIQKGYTGKKSIAYKILKYNGKTISKTVLSKDTYKPMNKIVERGTKKVVSSKPTVTHPVTPSVPQTQPTDANIIKNNVSI